MKRIISIMLILIFAVSLSTAVNAAESRFTDIPNDIWYFDDVMYAYEHDIMKGVSATDFSPDETLTRAMLATILYRMSGSPEVSGTDEFDDTVDGEWYSDAILWSSNEKVMIGYGNGKFGTDDNVVLEEFITASYRFFDSPSVTAQTGIFDNMQISNWAKDAFDWVQGANIIDQIPEDMLVPSSNISRALCAALIHRSLMWHENTTDTGKTLIVYFTWSSNTERMANTIKELTGADILEIVPQTPYPEDYTSCTEVALEERDNNARPAIKDLPESLDQYDNILIGYPIWWHTAPMIIGTFLESYDLTDVDIYPFTQSASMNTTQFDNSMEFIRDYAKEATVHNGLFTRAYNDDAIKAYLTENDLIAKVAP